MKEIKVDEDGAIRLMDRVMADGFVSYTGNVMLDI